MKEAKIIFTWKGIEYTDYIHPTDIANDINGVNDYWGTIFNSIGLIKRYQFQICWESHQIAIFEYGGTEPIDYVYNFKLEFNVI